MQQFLTPGKASFIVGGQWGSEGKGAAAAWLGRTLAEEGKFFDIVTTNAGAQAGHTSLHNSKKRVLYHMPTAPYITRDVLNKANMGGMVYLNAGSIIDPDAFEQELKDNPFHGTIFVHPHAAVITQGCKDAEGDPESAQTKIASTRKGVGQALSRKILRWGTVARDHPFLQQFIRTVNLNDQLLKGKSVLVEVPQGVSLSINHSGFYPYTTSRDCTPMSAMSDAGIHPSFYGKTMVVLRTFPIRVGNIVEGDVTLGKSGANFGDQMELSWADIGVEAEITTVTKRIRRVFTFSEVQMREALSICRPDVIYLTFCDYLENKGYRKELLHIIERIAHTAGQEKLSKPMIILQNGPSTNDAKVYNG